MDGLHLPRARFGSGRRFALSSASVLYLVSYTDMICTTSGGVSTRRRHELMESCSILSRLFICSTAPSVRLIQLYFQLTSVDCDVHRNRPSSIFSNVLTEHSILERLRRHERIIQSSKPTHLSNDQPSPDCRGTEAKIRIFQKHIAFDSGPTRCYYPENSSISFGEHPTAKLRENPQRRLNLYDATMTIQDVPAFVSDRTNIPQSADSVCSLYYLFAR